MNHARNKIKFMINYISFTYILLLVIQSGLDRTRPACWNISPLIYIFKENQLTKLKFSLLHIKIELIILSEILEKH